MFKYEVENELKVLKPMTIDNFRKYIDKLILNQNKIIWFQNKGEKQRLYFCTHCQRWKIISSDVTFRKGDFMTCGNCEKRLEIIYAHNVIKPLETYISYLETNKRNELIIRTFFYRRNYEKKYGRFDEFFIEVSRINYDHGIAMKANSYRVMGSFNTYHANLHRDFQRDKTGFYTYYSFRNIANRSVKAVIKKTQYKYSVLDLAAKKQIDILDYLFLYSKYPKIELLMKAGATNLVADLVHRNTMGYSTGIFGEMMLYKTDMNLMRFICKYNLNYNEVCMYLKTGITDPKKLKTAVMLQFEPYNGKSKYVLSDLAYLEKENYSSTNYNDYLGWCEILGMDITNKKVRYPGNILAAHDETFKQYTVLKEREYDEQINTVSQDYDFMTYESNELLIRPVKSQQELVMESKVLDHCVRGYAQRVAHRSTMIFFVRQKEHPEAPFVTLELKGFKVIQCRAKKNARPSDDVISFVNTWCRKFKLETCFV